MLTSTFVCELSRPGQSLSGDSLFSTPQTLNKRSSNLRINVAPIFIPLQGDCDLLLEDCVGLGRGYLCSFSKHTARYNYKLQMANLPLVRQYISIVDCHQRFCKFIITTLLFLLLRLSNLPIKSRTTESQADANCRDEKSFWDTPIDPRPGILLQSGVAVRRGQCENEQCRKMCQHSCRWHKSKAAHLFWPSTCLLERGLVPMGIERQAGLERDPVISSEQICSFEIM